MTANAASASDSIYALHPAAAFLQPLRCEDCGRPNVRLRKKESKSKQRRPGPFVPMPRKNQSSLDMVVPYDFVAVRRRKVQVVNTSRLQ